MKLLNDLYTIVGCNSNDGFRFVVKINSSHIIFKAHFPGEPITPGVIILQIAEELIEVALEMDVSLTQVKNAKFLNIISPGDDIEIIYDLKNINVTDNSVSASITVSEGKEETIFTKMSIICQILQTKI